MLDLAKVVLLASEETAQTVEKKLPDFPSIQNVP
jgi:hypothetical protein